MERRNIDLDSPAFLDDFDTEVEKTEDTAVESQPEEVIESEEVAEEDNDSEEAVEATEEQRVPYSRFKTANERAKAAEDELARLRAERQEASNRQAYTPPEPQEFSGSLPSYWTDMYGDSEESRKAYAIHVDTVRQVEERAVEAALSKLSQREQEAKQREAENLRVIEESFTTLSESIGRELTEKEQNALLDIVDEYTPKTANGTYAGAILSFDKAYEIYELRQLKANASKKAARTRVAAIASAKSEGEPSGKVDTFTPGKWGSWRDKLPRGS